MEENAQVTQKQPKIDYIKPNLISFAIGVAVGGITFSIFYFLGELNLIRAVDGASLAFAVVLCVGVLIMLSSFGAFDTFAFGFKQLGTMMFNRHDPRNEQTFVDYKKGRRDARNRSTRYYIGLFIASGVWLIAMVVLRILTAMYLKV